MEYDRLLGNAFVLREKTMEDYSNLDELLVENTELINICRICLGHTIEVFASKAEVSLRDVKRIGEGGEVLRDSRERMISYVISNFSDVKRTKIVELFGKNWVFVENKQNVRNWMKYDILYKFLEKYSLIIYLPLLFLFFGFLSTANLLLFSKDEIILSNYVLDIISSCIFFAMLALIVVITKKKSPMVDEIWMYTIAAALDDNINQAKKYMGFISRNYTLGAQNLEEYPPSWEDEIREVYMRLGKAIQERLIPILTEKNRKLIVEIFFKLGDLFGERNLESFVGLRNYLSEIEKEYEYHVYIPESNIQKVRSLLDGFLDIIRVLFRGYEHFIRLSSVIFGMTLIFTVVGIHFLNIVDALHKVYLFVAIGTFLASISKLAEKPR